MTRTSTPGLQDIANAAGVSKMTVSRVLRGGTGYSKETEKRVRDTAKRLGYVPNKLAAAFGKGGNSTLVGIAVPRLQSSLYGSLVETLSTNLSRLGYQTLVGVHDESPENEEAWLRSVTAWKPAGYILLGANRTEGARWILAETDVPVVEVWDLAAKPVDLAVGFSNYSAGQNMGRYLGHSGHQRFGYVGALAQHMTAAEQRLEGLKGGLGECNKHLTTSQILDDRPGFYAGFYGTETLLSRVPGIDCLYFHNDEMAVGGIAWIETQGLRVPDDIGVAGFGGMDAASVLPKRLTTTAVPVARMAKCAAEALVLRLRGDPVDTVIKIDTPLLQGDTTRG